MAAELVLGLALLGRRRFATRPAAEPTPASAAG
jgi:hypothetical protein